MICDINIVCAYRRIWFNSLNISQIKMDTYFHIEEALNQWKAYYGPNIPRSNMVLPFAWHYFVGTFALYVTYQLQVHL